MNLNKIPINRNTSGLLVLTILISFAIGSILTTIALHEYKSEDKSSVDTTLPNIHKTKSGNVVNINIT